jgi:sporulation protein YlmC with PRC-barrel domain
VVFRGLIGLFHNLLFLGKFSFAYNANVHTPASPWGPLVILVPVFGAAGVAGFPVVPTMSQMPDEEINRRGHSHNDGNPHLRSTQAIEGYHIQTSGGKVGHVTDFIMDDENWAICHLVIETGHWFAGRQIAISPEQIDRISSEESKVFVNVTKAAILEAPEYYVPPLDGASHEAPASPRTPNGQSKSVSF